jgi:mRNA-degrading endonuclease RelE of RelBE toxin-antitoxin system
MGDPYRLEYTPRASSNLEHLNHSASLRIIKKLEWLAKVASEISHEAMTGNWGGFFRYRVIEVEHVGHRRDVYDE